MPVLAKTPMKLYVQMTNTFVLHLVLDSFSYFFQTKDLNCFLPTTDIFRFICTMVQTLHKNSVISKIVK